MAKKDSKKRLVQTISKRKKYRDYEEVRENGGLGPHRLNNEGAKHRTQSSPAGKGEENAE